MNAKSLEEAVSALGSGNSSVIAGGTDLLGTQKDNILPDYPLTVINIKSIPGLDYIKEEDGMLKIGALACLADIAENPRIKEKYTALAQAAKRTATPNVRQMGTIGGNIAQLPRCWYFRKPENRFYCLRKGGEECFAILGENRYHSIFGGMRVGPTPVRWNARRELAFRNTWPALRNGNWDEAARIIMQVNPMPAITGRVCAHFASKAATATRPMKLFSSAELSALWAIILWKTATGFISRPRRKRGKQ